MIYNPFTYTIIDTKTGRKHHKKSITKQDLDLFSDIDVLKVYNKDYRLVKILTIKDLKNMLNS